MIIYFGSSSFLSVFLSLFLFPAWSLNLSPTVPRWAISHRYNKRTDSHTRRPTVFLLIGHLLPISLSPGFLLRFSPDCALANLFGLAFIALLMSACAFCCSALYSPVGAVVNAFGVRLDHYKAPTSLKTHLRNTIGINTQG